MNLSRDEHIEQAEMLVREAEQDLAVAGTQDSYRRIELQLMIAQAHAFLADTKRVTL